MFFKKRSNIIFRNYENFGYITDNRNFGYNKKDDNENYIGDRILSKSGMVFFSVLGRKAETLDNLAKEIMKHFTDVDLETIKNDAKEFYLLLEQDGFVVSGETIQECDVKDTKFSYKTFEQEITKDCCSTNIHPEKSTQEFFEEYFKGKPQLTNLHIDITSKCNERCVHCYIPHDHKVGEIEPDLFYAVLQQCKNMCQCPVKMTP